MSEQSIQVADELLKTLGTNTRVKNNSMPTPQNSTSNANSISNAANQAMPGSIPPTTSAGRGPQVSTIPTVVKRNNVVQPSGGTKNTDVLDLSDGNFENNLSKLLAKDLTLAEHDRALAVALFQVHLDRAEVLDGMPLSMPVAQVIGDNTGATLKALELAMKAGERLHKTAELLVLAQKNADATALAALKAKMAREKNDTGWGDETP